MTGPVASPSADVLEDRQLVTDLGVWDEYLLLYRNDFVVVMVLKGDDKKTPLVRIHSTCFAAHYLRSIECDCREQLDEAYEEIFAYGHGAIVLLEQDGRANGHAALMRAAKYAKEHDCTQSEAYTALGYPADSRDFRAAGAVLKRLGIVQAIVVTNNPRKIAGLTASGIDVTEEKSGVVSKLREAHLARYYELKRAEGYRIP